MSKKRRDRSDIRAVEDFLKSTRSASPWTEALKAEYHREGLDQWNNRKVYEVCRIFRCTLAELCAWAGLFNHMTYATYEAQDRWPMYLTLQWNKLVKFKFQTVGADVQDAMAAQGFYWGEPAKNEEEKAA